MSDNIERTKTEMISTCHAAPVEQVVEQSEESVEKRSHLECAECGEACHGFAGSKKEMQQYLDALKERGVDPDSLQSSPPDKKK